MKHFHACTGPCIGLLVGLWLLVGCVSELKDGPTDQAFTSISGVLTNSTGQRTVFVRRHRTFQEAGEPLSASGAIFKNGQLETELIEIRPGDLAAPLGFEVQAGASYHVEIETVDGNRYRTEPQRVRPRIRTDSLTFALEKRLTEITDLGVPVTDWYIDVYAYITVPETITEPRYFRWQVDESWSFVSGARTCYPRVDVSENPSTLAAETALRAGPVPVRIATNIVDEQFLHVHYFNAYLHTLDEASYQFYLRSQRLAANDGNLFDEVPGPVRGNVQSLQQDEDDYVVGNIEFSLPDTLRLRVEREDFNIRIFDECSTPLACTGIRPGVPCKCVDCASVFGIGTLAKPFYWE